ncbi:nickel-responsive transcriptional regulator NikR [Candidatus Bathyarchaeota archaeon]|nr:nickel-responsive transcriptional regulator NikR [Candidatus Bathyarchaeota archaeon]MBS7613500.1 nickel-responsive transcriptional regulator NikR [Candidatus Bathyarchaeota archaeon]MBS7617455.1 nickel-responsive transcriptional regulator NikR [Candidatus Bathyarchaeota archaeon]
MSKGIVRFSASISHDLLTAFDRFIRDLNYSRSRAVQEAMRMFMDEHTWKHREGVLVFGTLNIFYDHETRELEESLTDIQHSYRELIISTLHIHVDERNCMLIISVKGESSRIKKLVDEIAGRKGVKQLKTVTFTI